MAKEFYDGVAHMPFSVTFVFALAAMDPSYGFYDYLAKITYDNGDYDIISQGMQQYAFEADEDGFGIYDCCVDWNLFIEGYLD